MTPCPAWCAPIPPKPEGAGYRAEITDLLTTPDQWFDRWTSALRRTARCMWPTGMTPVSEDIIMADQNVATMTGRIYRLAPPGNKPTVPKLNLNSAAGCVEALAISQSVHPVLGLDQTARDAGARRERAWLKLWKKGESPQMRARALQLLARIPGREKQYVDLAMKETTRTCGSLDCESRASSKLDTIPLDQNPGSRQLSAGPARMRHRFAAS